MRFRFMAVAALAMFAVFASADTITATVDVSGLTSVDGIDDLDNADFLFDLGFLSGGYTDFVLTHVGWDNVTIETIGFSWLSEPVFAFENASLTDGLFVTVGIGDDFSGTETYSSGGLVDLAAIDPDLPVVFDPDNLLRFHIFEDFDDVADAIDANILSGVFTLQFEANAPVPEPASMVALGLGLVSLLRRRSKV